MLESRHASEPRLRATAQAFLALLHKKLPLDRFFSILTALKLLEVTDLLKECWSEARSWLVTLTNRFNNRTTGITTPIVRNTAVLSEEMGAFKVKALFSTRVYF